VTDAKLKSLVERAEKIIEERKAVSSDLKDIFSEAKGVGYEPRYVRKIIAERAMDASDLAEQEAVMDAYRHALGMVAASVSNGDMSLRQAARESGFSKSAIHREVSHQMRDSASGTVEMTLEDLGDPLWIVDKDRARFRDRVRAIAAKVKTLPELDAALDTLPEDDLAIPDFLRRVRA
jgi:uncharacterized protein (UPF0335 family)